MTHQLPLPGIEQKEKIVNVASVKHRSPFRYPGGKTWLVPTIRRWFENLRHKPSLFIEPFAGGAIIGLTVAFEQLADHVTLAEIDPQVAAVWDTIINSGEACWLAEQIATFELTPDKVDSLLDHAPSTERDRALQVIVKNRVNRGGILAKGAGRLKNGENGRGIASRWYPQTLQRRILDIDQIAERLTFVHGDGFHIIEQHADDPDAVFFVDPPYTASGKRPGSRLYDHCTVDHERLFERLANVSGDFLMTYDNDPAMRALADRFRLAHAAIPMKSTHHAKLTELVIGRDLSWMTSS